MNDADRRVLVTGATGLVGGALVRRLHADRFAIRVAVRRAANFPPEVAVVEGASLTDPYDWRPALGDCGVVVHCAGRAHLVGETGSAALAEFRRVNVHGTATLAEQAADTGVRRFVYLSSLKVNGGRTRAGAPFRASDAPAPEDPYSISKMEAEERLRDIASRSGMQLAIVRPSLVYGPGVRANFRTMLDWLHRGVPLPFGGVRNRRSFVAVENLADCLVACATHANAAGRTFLVSDGEDVSTPELLQRAGTALGRPARLFAVPEPVLRLLARAPRVGRGIARLIDSLEADISETRALLAWNPPVTIDQQLAATARWYLLQHGGAR